MNYTLIKTGIYNQFYCNKCHRAMPDLYIDMNKERYCESCIKLQQGDKIKIMTQNREIIEIIECK